jgi:3'(2'), 5'-bisphosphate nucleotidase
MTDLQISDAQLSSMVAQQAGQLLLELRDSFGAIDPGDKDLANELRKAGDAAANEFIVAALREARPDDGLWSEEE